MRLSALRTIREKKTTAAICFGIVCVMIVAAFWPFSFHPTNHVTWLSDQNGLRFSGGGIVLSTRGFEFADPQSTAGVSLELWLEPSQEKYSTALLSFSSHNNPEQFRLRQSHDFLLIVQESFATSRHQAARGLWVPHVFQAHKRRFIAICSGASGTTVYLDGVPAENSSTFKIDPKGFSGQLIVGASPTAYDTWRGELFGLALFSRELTAAQLSEHYQAWSRGLSETLKSDQPAALYTLAERSGTFVHNQMSSGPDLAIPASYRVPYKPFLKPPWMEFYPNQAYFRDVFINISGFVPFGFFFCMLFSSSGSNRKALFATIMLGAVFSLTIEVLQGFIPMRDSGTTDILTNTLGTAVGATLCRWGMLHPLFGRSESRSAG
jgi:hypothetical protein